MRSFYIAVCAVLLAATLAPVPFAGASDERVLASGGEGSQGWAVEKGDHTGGNLTADAQICHYSWAHWASVMVFEDPDAAPVIELVGGGNEYREGLSVRSQTLDVGIERDLGEAEGGGCSSVSGASIAWDPGTYYFVFFAAGDGDEWSYTLSTDSDDTKVLDNETGEDAFFAPSRDFTGLANAQLWPTGGDVGAGALAATEYPLSVDGRLVGFYDRAGALTVDTPDGVQACPCEFHDDGRGRPGDATDPLVWGPGSYSFQATGVGATSFADLRLVGADVVFP